MRTASVFFFFPSLFSACSGSLEEKKSCISSEERGHGS